MGNIKNDNMGNSGFKTRLLRRLGLACLSLGTAVAAQAQTPSVEPPYWFTGMENDTLQLLIHGQDVARYNASVNYRGVKVVGQPSTDSPNYKLVYLTIDKKTKPGTMEVNLSDGNTSIHFPYQLFEKSSSQEGRRGFDAGDVLYLIMPDRFSKGPNNNASTKTLRHPVAEDRNDPHGRHGGNLAGISQHLGYLDSLGVTALWLCPVLENDMEGGSYHGYATTDYYRVDPRFGTNDEYRELVEDAHKRGLKVVMDMIFNHTGSDHPWMEDMPTRDWYNHPAGDVMTNFELTTVHDPYASDYDRERTVKGWFVPSMPDLNQGNPHVMKYLIQNSLWWIETVGIDGIRMDTYPYADEQAMDEWVNAVKAEYPGFNIVGECWYANTPGGASWQRGAAANKTGSTLPTVMDFWLMLHGRDIFSNATGDNGDSFTQHGLKDVYAHLTEDFLYADPQKVLTFLDNHDTDRFLKTIPTTELEMDTWKQAQTLLMTTRGIPQIYYGTELLMYGDKAPGDGYVRLDMPGGFPGDSINAFTPEGRTPEQNEAWTFLSTLLNWRRGEANRVIAEGKLKHFIPVDGVYVYERRLGDKVVAVVLNGTDKSVTLDTAPYGEIFKSGQKWTNALKGSPVSVTESISLKPRESLILQNF